MSKRIVSKDQHPKDTLCWWCVNAVPDTDGKKGCEWSRSRKPVEGWEAKKQMKIDYRTREYKVAYRVDDCPKFKKG